MNRRDFVIWSAVSGVAALRQRGPTVRLGLVTPTGATMRTGETGIRMGLDEAQRAASLFGGQISLSTIAGDARRPAAGAALTELIRRRDVTAVFGGEDTAECAALAEMAARLGILYFNIASSDDSLRGPRCHTTTFHVMPSAAMWHDALSRAEKTSDTNTRCVAWDASLERFGADTLNQRFQTRYGHPMTDVSWTGWLAVKMLWESALRARTAAPAAVGTMLTQPSTRFDGHKGRALSFRPWDHQLRQPVYLVAAGSTARRAIEVPFATSETASSTDVLDELGLSAERTACRWAR